MGGGPPGPDVKKCVYLGAPAGWDVSDGPAGPARKKIWGCIFGLTAPQGPLGKILGVYFGTCTSIAPRKILGRHQIEIIKGACGK